MLTQRQYDELQKSLDGLKVVANNFAIRFINDVAARRKYNELTKQMSDDIMHDVKSGKITPLQGADKAKTARNIIMEQVRRITSDIGKAEAEAMKAVGKTLYELENKYALELFKKQFIALTEAERNQVFLKIIARSGKPQAAMNLKMRKLGRAGRLMIILTIAVAVYNVTTAGDKAAAAQREAVTFGGGFLGGAAGGVLAGLACGPGAPVCSTIGVFIGGILGAIGSDYLFDFFSSDSEESLVFDNFGIALM
jgi:hypothetical protein